MNAHCRSIRHQILSRWPLDQSLKRQPCEIPPSLITATPYAKNRPASGIDMPSAAEIECRGRAENTYSLSSRLKTPLSPHWRMVESRGAGADQLVRVRLVAVSRQFAACTRHNARPSSRRRPWSMPNGRRPPTATESLRRTFLGGGQLRIDSRRYLRRVDLSSNLVI